MEITFCLLIILNLGMIRTVFSYFLNVKEKVYIYKTKTQYFTSTSDATVREFGYCIEFKKPNGEWSIQRNRKIYPTIIDALDALRQIKQTNVFYNIDQDLLWRVRDVYILT